MRPMLHRKMSRDVAKMTLLDTIITDSVQFARNMSIAMFAASRIPPIDKLRNFIFSIFFNYYRVGGTGGVGGATANRTANSGTCIAGTQLGIP